MAVKELQQIASKFDIHGEVIKVEENLCGHINKTFIVHVGSVETAQEPRRYILQRINHHVFQDPIAVMRNIKNVTQHIECKLRNENIRYGQKTLTLIPMKECHEQYYFQNDEHDGSIWRCYNFMQGCKTYNTVENAKQAYQAAYAFGIFQNLVSDIPIETILETIPDFHNTPKRLERLLEVVKKDRVGRLKNVENEMHFIRRRKHLVTKLINLCRNGKIPIRITHNDTKINNVMMDIVTDEAVCVIDLDTVMPGLSLYDFGDLVRSTVSPTEEDEVDLSKVEFRRFIFEALVQGYIDSCDCLVEEEIQNLVFSGILMTLEVGMRFLTDYLEGDLYFKTTRESHNLDRARTQFRLVELLEDNLIQMEDFVQRVYKEKVNSKI
jgi:hypothetical protein